MHSGALRRSSISVANFKQLTPLCVLFPVLGIHFFLVPARPEHKSQYEHSYDLLLTISSSFQGKESREQLLTLLFINYIHVYFPRFHGIMASMLP